MKSSDLVFPPGPRRVCRVRAGRGVSDRLLDDLTADPPGARLVVVSDSNVAPLHGEPLMRRLAARQLDVTLVDFPAGEASKTRDTKATLEDRLYEAGVGRDAALIALGGGVTGDLAGFVAATWHRGIPVIQAPTSMLAMADAALGGKTAVDLPGGKNLVGAFHQPLAIYADVDWLTTLPDGPYVDGFAEVVKSAAIADAAFFRWLEGNVDTLLARDPGAQAEAVVRCIEIKGRVVRADEREAGRRAVLNFGHTVAHAIEAATDYAVRHGPAVAIGMCVEAGLARDHAGLSTRAVARLERLLARFGLPVRLPRGIDVRRLVAATARDKKVRAGEVHYALPRAVGRMLPAPRYTVPVAAADLERALEARLT